MIIQHLTDLHLDINRRHAPLERWRVSPHADVIALTGDLSNHAVDTLNFLRYQLLPMLAAHQQVVFVFGNHEYYGCSLEEAHAQARDLEHPRLHFLEAGRVFEYQDVCFAGDTLWTDFAACGRGAAQELAMLQAMEYMADYRRIRWQGRLLQPADTVQFFRQAVAVCARALATTTCTRRVMLSHHAPSTGSIAARFTDNSLNPAFISALLETQAFAASVDLWLHGHVHDSFDYVVAGTRVVCNPLGYLSSGLEGQDFVAEKLLEV